MIMRGGAPRRMKIELFW